MEFLDPKKRRAHNIRLFIGYILMGIAIIMTSIVLMHVSNGISYDLSTRSVIQKGMVFISSQPVSADIHINGSPISSRTNARLTLEEGQYEFEVRANGYRPWRRILNLLGGTVERLMYPRLFPEHLTSETMRTYSGQPSFVTQSPDRQWLLVQRAGTHLQFEVVNLNDPKEPVATLSLPRDLVTDQGEQRWSSPEWSTDNRHVLVRHDFEGGHEYVIIDRQGENSVNLNRHFGLAIPEATLRDKAFDKYYFFDPETRMLRTAELSSRSVALLLSDVLSYKSHGNNVVLYTTDSGAPKGKARVMILEGIQSYHVRDITLDSPHLLDIARFDGSWYMVMGAEKENRVHVYKDAVSEIKDNPERLPLPVGALKVDSPKFIGFSNNARFVMAQHGSSFAVYDAETDRHYTYTMDTEIEPTYRAVWMDGHRLSVVSAGHVHVFDYDGINHHELSASRERFTPYFDRDYTAMYALAAPSGGDQSRTVLVRTSLIVEE